MSGGTEAGWHNDPLGRHESRYWDGTQWTEHVSDAGVQSTDPLEQAAQPGGVVDPTQTIVTGGAPTAQMPSAPAAEGLPPYANSGAQKSGGFPIVPVVLGLVAAAVVIGALVFFIGGDDKGGGGEIGASTATLDADSPVATYEVTLDRGEGVRFRAAGADSDLDPVFAMGVSEDEANALFSDLVAEEFFSDGEATLGELFSDIADDTLSDYPPGDTGIESGQLYEIDRFDDHGSGTPEAGSFIAPRSATYTVVLYEYSGEAGDFDVLIERWDGNLDFADLSDFVDGLSDVTSDDPFFTDGDFFSDSPGFSDFSDFTDLTDPFSDFSDFTDPFSDFSDPFSDFSDFTDPFSDFSDLSDLTDFIDPFTDLFSDFFTEFSDFSG